MVFTEVKKVIAVVIESLEVMAKGCIGFGEDNVADAVVHI
jgi:hypothetical protein